MIIEHSGAFSLPPSLNESYLSDKDYLLFTSGSYGEFKNDERIVITYTGASAPEMELVVGRFVSGQSAVLDDVYKLIIHTFTDSVLREYAIITEPFSDSITDTSSLVTTTLLNGDGAALANIVLDGGAYGIYIKRALVSGSSKTREDYITFRSVE